VINPIFQGVYERFQEVKFACTSENLGQTYPLDIWKERQLGYLEYASHSSPREESLSKILRSNRINQILDFGGGSGWLFKYLSNIGFEIESQIVVETNETISWFKEFNQEVTWMNQSSLGDLVVLEDQAVLYTNSCIQYLEDLENDFLNLLSHPWKFVLLEDIPNLSNRDIWTRQHYYNFEIPYHFFNLDLIIANIESRGYVLESQNEYLQIYPENWHYQIEHNQNLIIPSNPKTLVFSRH